MRQARRNSLPRETPAAIDQSLTAPTPLYFGMNCQSGALYWDLQFSVRETIMFCKEKSEASILRVLVTALGVFLVAASGTLATSFSPMRKHAEMQVTANPAPDAGCQGVLDAGEKLFTTPFHMYMTQTSGGTENGKTMISETVLAGGTRYVMVNGKWSLSPISTDELKQLDQRNRRNAKNQSCHYVRDESANGQSAAVYSAHSESEHAKDDSQIWLSKRTGLILRQEIDLDTGRAGGTIHVSVRYEYGNVQAPKL
jgi:hypothetical protein